MKIMLILLMGVLTAQAQLSVTVSPVKITGQKAVVTLAMKNMLNENVESARATLILLDEQGKMVGQSAKWVIGGSEDKPGLASGGTNTYNFVITANNPFTSTNLTTTVQFNRVILEGGKLADVTKDVIITQTIK